MTRADSNDAAVEALRTAARSFVTEIGDVWGGDSMWVTTGTRVAEVVACVLREMADDVARRCPTCVHPEGYDRLSGPCPTCHGDGVRSSPGGGEGRG